jgi:hypothetical protein
MQNQSPETTQTNTPVINKVLNAFKVVAELLLTIGFIFFEEVIWETVVLKIKAKIVKMNIFKRLQTWIEAQNNLTTLGFFIAPFVTAELLSIYSGGLVVTGHIFLGLILYVAKLPVAGIAFWIFSFSKEKLLSYDWFNTLYILVIRFFEWVKSTKIYKRVRTKINHIKEYFKNLKGEGNGTASRFSKIYKDLKKLFKENNKQ